MDESNIRILVPADEIALQSLLTRHWASSTAMRANLASGGLDDEGEYTQGTYAALFDGETIVAVATHYRDGTLMLQAPRGVGQVVRAAVSESGRFVERVVGIWSQVSAAAEVLGSTPKKPFAGRPQALLTLDMAKFMGDAVKSPEVKIRVAMAADIPTLVNWRANYVAKEEGTPDGAQGAGPTEAALQGVRSMLEKEIASENLFVAETAQSPSRLLAMASIEARHSEAAQIGALWSPPALKEKAFTAHAVLAAVSASRVRGARHIALISEKTDVKALASFRTMGFFPMDEFGALYVPI